MLCVDFSNSASERVLHFVGMVCRCYSALLLGDFGPMIVDLTGEPKSGCLTAPVVVSMSLSVRKGAVRKRRTAPNGVSMREYVEDASSRPSTTGSLATPRTRGTIQSATVVGISASTLKSHAVPLGTSCASNSGNTNRNDKQVSALAGTTESFSRWQQYRLSVPVRLSRL